jgi:hypothetical protein
MKKEILRRLPDGDYDYDGEEETEDLEEIYQREWENSTLYW